MNLSYIVNENAIPVTVVDGGGFIPTTNPIKDLNFDIDIKGVGITFYYVDKSDGRLYGGRSADLVVSDDNGTTWTKIGTRIVTTGVSVQNLFVTSKKTLISLCLGGGLYYIYRSIDNGVTWTKLLDLGKSYLLNKSWCEFPKFDGTNNAIFMAEYTIEDTLQTSVRLWRSIDDGATFTVINEHKRLGDDGIRHWHFAIYDHWDKCVWLGSGDLPKNNKLYKIKDGQTLEYVGGGTYDWKFVTVIPDRGVLHCVSDRTDSYSYPTPFYQMDKRTSTLKIMGYTSSTAWYGDMTKYNIPFFLTQLNPSVTHGANVQGYICYNGMVNEAMNIPAIQGTGTLHVNQVFSNDDYVFIDINQSELTEQSGFMRAKITPIRG